MFYISRQNILWHEMLIEFNRMQYLLSCFYKVLVKLPIIFC